MEARTQKVLGEVRTLPTAPTFFHGTIAMFGIMTVPALFCFAPVHVAQFACAPTLCHTLTCLARCAQQQYSFDLIAASVQCLACHSLH